MLHMAAKNIVLFGRVLKLCSLSLHTKIPDLKPAGFRAGRQRKVFRGVSLLGLQLAKLMLKALQLGASFFQELLGHAEVGRPRV